MKKLKTILSIALICVLALGGGMLLTGCEQDDSQAKVGNEEIELYSTPWDNEFYKIEFLGAECTSGNNANINIAVTVKKETTFDVEVNHGDFKIYYLNNMYDASRNPLVDTNFESFTSGGVTITNGTQTVKIFTLTCELSNLGFRDSAYELTWNGYSLAVFVPYTQTAVA